MPALESGQIFERYRVIRWLGSGVSGESYEAEDSMLLRKVTLKLIHPQSTLPDSARRQFFRELQGISALNHPYLAPVLDYGELNGRLYIARTFIDNGSLLGTEGRLWFRPPLNLSDAIYFTHQLAQALHYTHIRGYLHGSITFSNILVLRGPILDKAPDYAPFLLADVGLANFVRRYGQEPKPPFPVTTAPEQLDRRILPASDQFALATLLYFWLSGRPPYLGTPAEIEQLKLTEKVIPLSTLNTQVSIKQDGILLRALSAHPEDRYPSLLTFADALLKTLAPVSALPTIPATEPARFDGLAILSSTPRHEEEQLVAIPVSNAASQQITRELPVLTETDLTEEHVMESSSAEEEPGPATTTAGNQSQTVVAEPPIAFGTIPQTDPITNFEPPVLAELVVETSANITPAANQPVDQAAAPQLTSTGIPRLIITSPYENEPYEVNLEGDEFTIGRAGSSSILLDYDNLASRHHALLKRKDSRFLIYDRSSSNGVFVNGQKIVVESDYELLDGDHIGIGNYELIFRSGSSPAQTESAPSSAFQPDIDYQITHLV